MSKISGTGGLQTAPAPTPMIPQEIQFQPINKLFALQVLRPLIEKSFYYWLIAVDVSYIVAYFWKCCDELVCPSSLCGTHYFFDSRVIPSVCNVISYGSVEELGFLVNYPNLSTKPALVKKTYVFSIEPHLCFKIKDKHE